jgi:class 3 adenylate cyclase
MERNVATRNLTIMFTDIKGFTKRVSDATRKDLNWLLETHETLLRPVFAHFNGIIVKTIGNLSGFLTIHKG